MFSGAIPACHFAAALLLDFLCCDVSATRAIHVASQAARRTLLKDDQAFVVVAINKKGRLVQWLEPLVRDVLSVKEIFHHSRVMARGGIPLTEW
jgi:hypothetical protein